MLSLQGGTERFGFDGQLVLSGYDIPIGGGLGLISRIGRNVSQRKVFDCVLSTLGSFCDIESVETLVDFSQDTSRGICDVLSGHRVSRPFRLHLLHGTRLLRHVEFSSLEHTAITHARDGRPTKGADGWLLETRRRRC